MDPNANIREQIAILRQGIYSYGEQDRLHELINAYADWRAAGGFAASASLRAELATLTSRTPGATSYAP